MGQSLLERQIRRAGTVAAFLQQLNGELKRQATLQDLQTMMLTWALVARPEQLPPPGTWTIWLILAGRGFGKTRSGAEWIKQEVDAGRARRIALVGATAADVRDVMIEGESGILSLYNHLPEDQRPKYEPSKRRITWPNGAIATAFSAEKADRLRGPQHDTFWADELASWTTKVKKEKGSPIVQTGRPPAWDQLLFGLRLGEHPRGVVTTTPRPTPIIRELVKDQNVAISKGTTYENRANLAPAFFGAILRAYEGTRIGRQELNAEILDDNPNALWKQERIDQLRVVQIPAQLERISLAIDPAVTSNPESDMTGIVAAGRVASCHLQRHCKGETHAIVLEDDSGIFTPTEWAMHATEMFKRLQADKVVGEVNNGGDLVEVNLRANGGKGAEHIPYQAVRASRGKAIRADPVSTLYEKGKVHHYGTHGKLEDEMTQWDPISGLRSPSRMDALVWALTDLMLVGQGGSVFDVL